MTLGRAVINTAAGAKGKQSPRGGPCRANKDQRPHKAAFVDALTG